MYRDNPLRAKLRTGAPALGCWLLSGSAMAAELLGLAGYDVAVIDQEHGPAGLTETVAMLQALAATPAAAVVRVPWNDAVLVKRVLDLGVDGIMFPSIGSAEEARAAVAACRYPPAGIRGAAYGVVRASDYGLAAERYRAGAEENLLIICQIETVAGVTAIPEIAAVPGVDVLFIGPYDLSGSLGKLGRFGDPEVCETIFAAERAIKATGRWLGSLPSLGRSPAQMVRGGVDLVVAGADIGLPRDAAAAELQTFRRELGDGAG